MAAPDTPDWLQTLHGRITDAHEAAERAVIAVALDGAQVYSMHLGVTSGDVEAAALAILGDILEHYAATPADQLCESCVARIVRVQTAYAALTDGETAPVVADHPGARLQ